jgi:hypothetical protein
MNEPPCKDVDTPDARRGSTVQPATSVDASRHMTILRRTCGAEKSDGCEAGSEVPDRRAHLENFPGLMVINSELKICSKALGVAPKSR